MGISNSKTALNALLFVNQDSITRTITFTPNAGLAEIPPLVIPGYTELYQDMPNQWIGNFYSVSDGAVAKPGMLGEVNFNSWTELTFFDVSAIVDPTDTDGVQWMYPAAAKSPASGCDSFLCDNVYILPDDVQTKATRETEIVVILGKGAGVAARGVPAPESAGRRHARDFREAKFPRSFIETNPQSFVESH